MPWRREASAQYVLSIKNTILKFIYVVEIVRICSYYCISHSSAMRRQILCILAFLLLVSASAPDENGSFRKKDLPGVIMGK